MFDIFKPYSKLFIAFSEKEDGSMKYFGDAEHQDLAQINFKNREKYLQKFGIDAKDVAIADLQHGSTVEVVQSMPSSRIVSNCDGLITDKEDIVLSVTTADCLPIFLYEPEKKICGLVHAGWKSLDKNILKNAMGKIEKLGGRVDKVLVGIGPAICQKHYHVGKEVSDKFEKYPSAISQSRDVVFLDLKEAAKLQLKAAGVLGKNIETSSACTFELNDKYFSARRDRPKEVEAMLALIGTRSN